MKKILIIIFVLIALFAVGGSVFADNFWLDFTLANYTDMTIMELYVSPSDEWNWGDDVLTIDVLGSGEMVELSFSEYAYSDFWDIKGVDEYGDEWIWDGLDLTEITYLYLYSDGSNLWAEWE